MPIYEYRCQDCGDEFEVLQKMNAASLRKCKKCSGRLEKLISRAAFQLKGGGWYASGYSKSGSGSGSGSAPSSSSTTKTGSESSTSSGKSSGGKDSSGSSDASQPKAATA